MAKKEKDVLLDHVYDGIQELDNDLPPWWLYLFYFSIAFAFVYLMYYHVLGIGPSSAQEYQMEMNPNVVFTESSTQKYVYQSPYNNGKVDLTPELRKQFSKYIGDDVPFDLLIAEAKQKANADQLNKLNEAFPGKEFGSVTTAKAPEKKMEQVAEVELLTDPADLKKGAAIFKMNCVPCHAKDGGGSIGPNLTDDYWIHGGKFQQIVHTITVGVPAKGMITWGKTMSKAKIQLVASYVKSLRGTTPAKPKAPQGVIEPPE